MGVLVRIMWGTFWNVRRQIDVQPWRKASDGNRGGVSALTVSRSVTSTIPHDRVPDFVTQVIAI